MSESSESTNHQPMSHEKMLSILDELSRDLTERSVKIDNLAGSSTDDSVAEARRRIAASRAVIEDARTKASALDDVGGRAMLRDVLRIVNVDNELLDVLRKGPRKLGAR